MMLYEQFAGGNTISKQNSEFCKGYYVDTVGKTNSELQSKTSTHDEDKLGEQLSIPEVKNSKKK